MRAFAFAVVACSPVEIPAPPAGFEHAAATRECGPADGPAVGIYLAGQPVEQLEPPLPYIRLYVWHGLGEVSGRTWSLAGDDAQGSAQYCPVSGECEVAAAGSVTVTTVGADSSLEASADVVFPASGRITGGIRARWLSRLVYCG